MRGLFFCVILVSCHPETLTVILSETKDLEVCVGSSFVLTDRFFTAFRMTDENCRRVIEVTLVTESHLSQCHWGVTNDDSR